MSLVDELKVASEFYADSFVKRAFIQSIPYIGGAIDTLMSGHGTQIQQERFHRLLELLEHRMTLIEKSTAIEASEELFDLFRIAVENSVRSRSDDKRERFANIIANTVTSESKQWDEAEAAMRLLSDLEDIHIKLLLLSQKSNVSKSSGKPYQYPITLERWSKNQLVTPAFYHPPIYLEESFPDIDIKLLTLACNELKAKGLLNSAIDTSSEPSTDHPHQFVISDLGHWLLNWISCK